MAEKQATNTQIYNELHEIKEMLAERKHIDVAVIEHGKLLDGNGRPGFRAIRDKVIQWDSKLNAVIVVILGDIAVRIVQYAVK